jgi:hypothetical protein
MCLNLRDYADRAESLIDQFAIDEKYSGCTTLRVSSLYDYLRIVDALGNEHDKDRYNIYNQFYYRGISNRNWKLEPSIAFKKLVPFEGKMVEELKQLRPDEFYNVDSDFNLLSKMQHYGLPTRLLDFSCNPLVALYFACCDTLYGNVDGRVYMTLGTDIQPSLRNYVESACSTYNNLWERVRTDESFRHTYLGIFYGHDNNVYFLKPSYITERERRQESVFLIFPNNLYDISNGNVITFEKGVQYVLGLSDDIIDIDNLTIHNSVMPIWKTTLKKHFICIDVCMESKPSIIKQLVAIGIKESFLFPELEYTSKMIRSKYEDYCQKSVNESFIEEYETQSPIANQA